MRKQRANYRPEEKVGILKKHFVENVPVSDLCERYGMHPNVFYRWQKEFFENGVEAFRKRPDGKAKKLEEKIFLLEEKLSKKNEVLSELMEEHIALKKSLGEL
jgi:transposase